MAMNSLAPIVGPPFCVTGTEPNANDHGRLEGVGARVRPRSGLLYGRSQIVAVYAFLEQCRREDAAAALDNVLNHFV